MIFYYILYNDMADPPQLFTSVIITIELKFRAYV